jgi:hypothetical protein
MVLTWNVPPETLPITDACKQACYKPVKYECQTEHGAVRPLAEATPRLLRAGGCEHRLHDLHRFVLDAAEVFLRNEALRVDLE